MALQNTGDHLRFNKSIEIHPRNIGLSTGWEVPTSRQLIKQRKYTTPLSPSIVSK